MRTQAELSRLACETYAVYRRQAARFDAERPKGLHERAWLARFVSTFGGKGSVLDVGCGAGVPFCRWFVAQGLQVTGVDVTPEMVALARQHVPEGEFHLADMRSLQLAGTFDGVLAWNSFFHLTPEEQRRTLPRLCTHLAPGGALLLTVGPHAGVTVGHVGGEEVYHSSLAPAEYEHILSIADVEVVTFVKEDPTCDMQTVLLGQKLPESPRPRAPAEVSETL